MNSTVQSYRDLDAWQHACDLAEAIYEATRDLPSQERYGLTSQMHRAAVCVPSNIAEGAGRAQPRDFARFARIASGSLSELRTLIELARRFGYLGTERSRQLDERADAVARMLYGLVRSLEAAARKP